MLDSIICAVIAYLLGSINSSIIVSRLMGGRDIRTQGSGNAGATNALRVLGKKAAVFVVLGDALKGVAAILIARLIAYLVQSESDLPIYVAGLFVTLGHNFPIFFGFRGGKGVLTSIVVILMVDPVVGGITLVVSLAIMAATRYVSLGACLGAVLLVVLAFLLRFGNWYFIVLSCLLALLLLVRHRANIGRLLAGTESKLGASNKGSDKKV